MINKLRTNNLITSTGRINANAAKILHKNNQLLLEILDVTGFLIGDNISISERLFVILNGISEQPICRHCDKPIRFDKSLRRYRDFCSVKCKSNYEPLKLAAQSKLANQRILINQKISDTKSKILPEQLAISKLKKLNTIISKYDTTNPWKDGIFDEKRRLTNINKYGVEYASQSNEVKQKISNNHANKLTDDNVNDPILLASLNHVEKHTLTDIASEFGVSKHAIWTRFQDHDIPVHHHYRSLPQITIEQLLAHNNIPYLSNDRCIIGPRELDVVLPQHNIAIEVNGIYWHSELNGKLSKYHLDKTNSCADKGIELIHLFDVEIITKWNIVQSIILHKTHNSKHTAYARKCVVLPITATEAKIFCDHNHIQGGIYGSYNFGLYYNNNLMAVLIAARSRFESGKIELLRFCSELNWSIVGGFSRLLSTLKQVTNDKIITYSDKRFGCGNVYRAAGFTLLKDTPPNYFYFHKSNPSKLLSRQQFQKHKLKSKLTTFNPVLSEWDNMKNNNYDRIWDCGHKKWEI